MEHINYQPELVAELNFTEVLIAAVLAIVMGAPLGVAIAFIIQMPIYSVAFGFGAALLCGLGTSKLMKILKRQRPDGYYVQLLMRKCEWVIPGVTFVRRTGYYDCLRHEPDE